MLVDTTTYWLFFYARIKLTIHIHLFNQFYGTPMKTHNNLSYVQRSVNLILNDNLPSDDLSQAYSICWLKSKEKNNVECYPTKLISFKRVNVSLSSLIYILKFDEKCPLKIVISNVTSHNFYIFLITKNIRLYEIIKRKKGL